MWGKITQFFGEEERVREEEGGEGRGLEDGERKENGSITFSGREPWGRGGELMAGEGVHYLVCEEGEHNSHVAYDAQRDQRRVGHQEEVVLCSVKPKQI